jgi:glycosyltransferase involved in cell wall biosynthesis
MPKVSVIIATRNRSELLPRALESARNAGRNVEIIVVDDASDDETANVCRQLSNDGLIRYVRASRRLGPGGARNAGLLSASSPYISFLDDDDVRLPGSLDAQLAQLEAHPKAGMVYGRVLYGDQNCEATGDFYPEECPQGDLFWELLYWNFIPSPTVVFRRSCLTRVGLLEEDAPGIEDWDLWVRIAELYPVLATEQTVAIWRRPDPSSGQFTSTGEKLHRAARRLHKHKWLRLPRATAANAEQRRAARRAFAAHASQQLVWEAASSLKAGHLPAFARVAFASVRMYPLGVVRKILNAKTWYSLTNKFGSRAFEQNNG